jgi:hypothetical protein
MKPGGVARFAYLDRQPRHIQPGLTQFYDVIWDRESQSTEGLQQDQLRTPFCLPWLAYEMLICDCENTAAVKQINSHGLKGECCSQRFTTEREAQTLA